MLMIAPSGEPKPVLKWSGAKWNLAHWICWHMPAHVTYLEPFFGSGAVFFKKPPSVVETINDLSGDIVHLFRVVRDQPEALARAVALTPWSREEFETCTRGRGPACEEDVERARRFLVSAWQRIGIRYGRSCWIGGWRSRAGSGAGSHTPPNVTWNALPERIAVAAERLKSAQIECRPALDVIRCYGNEETLIYADPPYVRSTRSCTLYPSEMTDAEHLELLDLLDAHPGAVLLSGYRSALYDERLVHWQRIDRTALAQSGAWRTECLWMNSVAVARLPQACLGLEHYDD